jgi:hypothetical protein
LDVNYNINVSYQNESSTPGKDEFKSNTNFTFHNNNNNSSTSNNEGRVTPSPDVRSEKSDHSKKDNVKFENGVRQVCCTVEKGKCNIF